MKDSYSFDRDEAGLEESFRAHERRLPPDLRALRDRVLRGAGGVGDDGRQRVGRLPRPVRLRREHARHVRERRFRRRPRGRAGRAAGARASGGARRARGGRDARDHDLRGPGRRSSGSIVAATSKAMPVTTEDGTVVLALVRGDDRLEPAKLAAALGEPVRPATEDEIRAAFGAEPGSLGPVGFDGEVIADETLREGQFVAGANRTGWHLRGVEHGRDFEARFADIRLPIEGDRCVRCGGELTFQTAIEVGHIFKLGHASYSVPLGATLPRRGRPGEAARDGQLRDRPRPRDGRGGRAAPRRAGASAGRRRSHRTMCTWSRCRGLSSRPRRRRRSWRRPEPTCCSTTATCAPARSSPTPT